MKVRTAGSTVTLAAAVAAAFAAFTGAGTAEAACASFWGVGNNAQCQSEIGSFAVVTTETGAAKAVGIGGAISLGGVAETDGLFTAALASGPGTHARAFGVGSLAQDVANDQNGQSAAVASGWFNRALNYGNNNVANTTSAPEPSLDQFNIGNNTVMNVGNNNLGIVPLGFSTGVYQFGDRNGGLAAGVLSNLIQVGSDNRSAPSLQLPLPVNSATGLFTTNNVFGNRNSSNAAGNIQGTLTVGDDNVNNVIGGPGENKDIPEEFQPNLSASNVFGNRNRVNVVGNADLTNVVGNDNKVGVQGNRNITSVFGDGNKVTPNKWHPNGIVGNNNITTSVGNQNKIGVFGNGNLTTNFGNRSKLRSFGDNNVNASLGDDKTSIKVSDS